MGKANQFEKRKARAQAAMVRTIEKRQPYDIVLVVCEGAKTEPNYLNSMKKDFGLNNDGLYQGRFHWSPGPAEDALS